MSNKGTVNFKETSGFPLFDLRVNNCEILDRYSLGNSRILYSTEIIPAETTPAANLCFF